MINNDSKLFRCQDCGFEKRISHLVAWMQHLWVCPKCGAHMKAIHQEIITKNE